MKKLFLLLLFGSCSLMVWAQTNSSAPKSPERDVGQGSDHFYFSGTTSRQLVYYGNVWVTNSQGKLTCGRLTLDLPPENSKDERPTNVLAETNVVIDYIKNGRTNHVTCDKMINVYRVVNAVTNDTFTFTGHARVSNGNGWMSGEPLVYDNVTGHFTGTGIETHFSLPSTSDNGTNASTNNVTSPFNFFK